jgi:hypothetical protein
MGPFKRRQCLSLCSRLESQVNSAGFALQLSSEHRCEQQQRVTVASGLVEMVSDSNLRRIFPETLF